MQPQREFAIGGESSLEGLANLVILCTWREQSVALDDTPRGPTLLAVDSVGAGVTERVLIVQEGRAAGEALGRKGAPVDAAIVGIIDSVDVQE